MNWPWVSRLAYDAVCAERDRLLVQNAALMKHTVAMDRVEHHLPEKERPLREPLDPMPVKLRDYCNGFQTAALRKQQRDLAIKRRLAGEPWDAIERDVLRPEPED